MYYLSIDVGGSFVKYATLDETGTIIEKDKRHTITDDLDGFLTSLQDVYEKMSQKYTFAGIALSVPGIIDAKKGIMHTGGYVTCISDFPIVQELEARCKIPVTVENDAKCAAMAEVWIGSLQSYSHAAVMICGTGVGGALVHNKEVLPGSHFQAGEFSYLLTNDEIKLDSCLAEKAGIRSLIQYVSDETNIPANKLNGESIFQEILNGDKRMLSGLKKYVRFLAIQIHNLQYIYDPECIAVGGGISVQPLFLELIIEELKNIQKIYPWKTNLPNVTVCKFFNDANLIGALYVHLREGRENGKKIS